MRVVIIGKYFSPYIGGIETVVEKLCFELSRKDCEVICLVSNDKYFEPTKEVNYEQFRVIKKTCFGTFSSTPLSLWQAEEINKLKPDVVHVHLPNPLPLFSLKKIKAKKIATYHASIVNKGVLGFLYKSIYRKHLSLFDKVIVTSQNIIKTNSFKELNVDSSKIEVIPLSTVHTEHFVNPKKINKKVIFAGRFVPYKGVRFLIEAVRDLNVHLTLVGDGPLKYEYVKQINALDLNDKVTIKGSMSRDQLFKELVKHDLFVLPSISEAEAFGLVALEAMSLGLPIITTDILTGISEINIHGKTGYIVPAKSSVHLAEKIQAVFQSHILYKQLAQSAYEHVRDNYNLQKFTNKHLDIFSTLIK